MKICVGLVLIAVAATVALGAPEDNGDADVCVFTMDMSTSSSVFSFNRKFKKALRHVIKENYTNISKCWSPNVVSTSCHSFMSSKISVQKCDIHTQFRCSLSPEGGECSELSATSLIGKEIRAKPVNVVVEDAVIVSQSPHQAYEEIDEAIGEEEAPLVGIIQ